MAGASQVARQPPSGRDGEGKGDGSGRGQSVRQATSLQSQLSEGRCQFVL